MYSTIGILRDTTFSEKIVGTHQKLDRVARMVLAKNLPKRAYFPTAKEIIHFEGMRGPDGLKIKSPGVDEPTHFIIPDDDDRRLITEILDHQYNLRIALETKNDTRSAFEAAWLAHFITDGLTPAHNFPLSDVVEDLMSEKDFLKLFGKPVKVVMRGNSLLQTVRNNWLYLGTEGFMSKHTAFEYGVAVAVSATPNRFLIPKIPKKDFKDIDLEKEFYAALYRVHALNMYGRFVKNGWKSDLALEVKKILLPEIIRMIALAWYSALPTNQVQPKKAKKK